MSFKTRWALGLLLVAFVALAPFVRFRWVYGDRKRLREVVPGRVYRSGQLTAPGFAEAVRRHGIRTVLNLQEDFPDPDVARHFFDPRTVKESELCRQLNVRYLQISPDVIARRAAEAGQRPEAIERFLQVMDDPSVYPVLIHCKAGLHRTGVLTAVYRMEYQGWTPLQAMTELRANGFGELGATAANVYISQYVLSYKSGPRAAQTARADQVTP